MCKIDFLSANYDGLSKQWKITFLVRSISTEWDSESECILCRTRNLG